jgi:predicted permease
MRLRERASVAWSKASALFRRRRLESELEEELRFHLELRADHYAAEGLPADAAREAAERRFGRAFALKEACREAWTFARLESLAQDARIALRGLRSSPTFTAVTVLSLGIGIGANAALFSLVDGVLLRPLPYPQPDRLVRLAGFYPKGALAALQERSRTMDVAGASADFALNLTGQGDAERLTASAVSANLFAVLERPALIGRAFDAGDDRPGRDGIVVLSHALWRARFGSDPSVVGRTLSLGGVDRQVVGVMPAGFRFPSASAQLWIPLRMDATQTEDYWGFGWMPLVARLRPEATRAQAHQELRRLVDEIGRQFPWPAPNWNPQAAAIPLQDDLVRDVRLKLLVLQSAVALVLLIACANVASLLLARAAARQKEMALRASLGAGRGRIVRQLLTESVTLSALGGALGLLLAWASLAGVQALLLEGAGDGAGAHIDGAALGFVTVLSVVCGLLFGTVPALSASRVDLAGAMKSGGQRSLPCAGVRARGAFIAAGRARRRPDRQRRMLIRTLWGLTQADPGFRSGQTLTVSVYPGASACDERAPCIALYDELLRRTRETAGVADAALASAVPLGGEQPLLPVELEGHPLRPEDAQATLLWAGAVTPGYFRLMHIPLLQGRSFEETDGEDTQPVVIVGAATARRFWPGQDPIGKTIRVVWDARPRTVVGVAGDVRQYALSGRAPQAIAGALYMPYPQSVALDRRIPRAMTLLARVEGAASEVAPRLRPLIASMSPDLPAGEVRPLDAVVATSVAEPRAMTWTFAAFAGCALLLAAIGTYGMVSYQVSQRTYEIGVRLAIGASRRQIFGLVVGQSLRLVLAGLAVGLGAAVLLGRALSSFLYAVSARDPLTFAAVAGLLLATAVLAAWAPGRRAARTDAVRALRAD